MQTTPPRGNKRTRESSSEKITITDFIHAKTSQSYESTLTDIPEVTNVPYHSARHRAQTGFLENKEKWFPTLSLAHIGQHIRKNACDLAQGGEKQKRRERERN